MAALVEKAHVQRALPVPGSRAPRLRHGALARASDGFSVVELMIAVLILSIVLAKTIPSVMDYIRDDRIRSVAEEMRDGLHAARMEAIRRNTTINFVPNATGWSVVAPGVAGAPDEILHARTAKTAELSLATAASGANVAFNGSGRLTTAGVFSVDIRSSTVQCQADGGEARCLRLNVASGGMIRMCDPALPAGNPQAC
jgi:type IV fimbrial biogenesis protein FimT